LGKKTKDWKPVTEEGFTPLQKVAIIAILAFIPFFIFILLPMLTRNHLITKMNIPEDLLLGEPELIHLVKTKSEEGEIPAIRVTIHGTTFAIPRNYTPVSIDGYTASFRVTRRRAGRTISVAALEKANPIPVRATGLLSWFIPENPLDFLDYSLWANWHPVRLICKAQLILSQGISGKVFYTYWDLTQAHKGYIFSFSGNSGYLGRVYGVKTPEYFEFAMNDEVRPVTLREWVNCALKIRPPFVTGEEKDQPKVRLSLADTIKKANLGEAFQAEVLETALNQFYATGQPSWILPVAIVDENRGFWREMIGLYRKYAPFSKDISDQMAIWNDLLDRSIKNVIAIDIDPHLQQNKIMIYCKNKSDFAIRKVVIRIIFAFPEGDRSFLTTIFDHETLYGGIEKNLDINPPSDFSVRAAQGISYRVEDIEISD